MNLTNEEIARVFAMYWGKEITTTYPNYDKCFVYGGQSGNLFVANKKWGHGVVSIIRDAPKLLLNPISKITDEDAIEVAKMYGGVRSKLDTDGFWQIIDNEGMVPRWFALNSEDIPSCLFQYLISKGYAVPIYFAPNHPENGKTAIELGLAIDATTLTPQIK